MSISMRWEAFKARRSSTKPPQHNATHITPTPEEPPHSLRQHFAVSTRKVESAGSTFEVYSVTPMKFSGEHGAHSQSFDELSPAHAASEAILYILPGGFINPIRKRNWDFIASLAHAGYRVDIPLYGLIPTYNVSHALPLILDCYQQLIQDHGSSNVHIIGDSAGGGLALAALTLPHWDPDTHPFPAPRTLILNAPWVDIALSNPDIAEYEALDPILNPDTLRHQGALWSRVGQTSLHSEHPAVSPLFLGKDALRAAFSTSQVHIFCGSADLSLPDCRSLAQKMGAQLHEISGAIHMFHLGHTPEAKAVRKQMLTIFTT